MTLDERIRGDIETRIRSGEWQPGHRIPFEHELVAQYQCARATVNKAIAGLVRIGLIERRRKAGSFVAYPHLQSAVLDIPNIGKAIIERGDSYRFALLNHNKRAPEPSSPEELTMTMNQPCLVLSGIHFAANMPFCLESRVINLTSVPKANDMDFQSTDPGNWLLEHVPWTDARHRISAIAAGEETADLLTIPIGSACLQIERWTWRLGAGITYVLQTFPAGHYDLVAEFKP
jgi:GntR family transcriptional regulator, histidine utilization repressor